MKVFFSHLYRRRWIIAAFFLTLALYGAVLLLYGLPREAAVYPAALCAAAGFLCLLLDYRAVCRRRRALRALTGLPAALLPEPPEPDGPVEAEYQAILRSLRDEAAARAARGEARYWDMVDYYTLWAHQIKTPIASMRLTLRDEDTAASRRLSRDLLRVEQYVEMVMAFLRLDSPSTDYVFRPCALEPVVRRAVRRYAEEFIARGLTVSCEPAGATVVTDEKWLGFVLEQLLSNALKYTEAGGITLSWREPSSLLVSDTGAGIAPEDLPRIFERGYTGRRGRLDQRASGLGLYLCKRICENLGADIHAESKLGEGTTVFIDFARETVEPRPENGRTAG